MFSHMAFVIHTAAQGNQLFCNMRQDVYDTRMSFVFRRKKIWQSVLKEEIFLH